MNSQDVLTLTQWLSPAYPVGTFNFSSGLETAIQSGRIAHPEDLENWLAGLIDHGSIWTDLVLFCAAYRSPDRDTLNNLAGLADALCATKERLWETQSTGHAFTRTTNAIWGLDLAPAPYPIVVGAAASERNIDLETIAYVYAHSVASNLISAAMRLMQIGQTDAQAILYRLTEQSRTTVVRALGSTLDDIGGCAFAADITSMNHEVQRVRIFQS